jgi:hypothetical protein
VDISKTLGLTTTHLGNKITMDIALLLGVCGLIGLHMLLGDVRAEGLASVAVALFFAIMNIVEPLKTNQALARVRALAWDCYGELITHSLLLNGDDGDDGVGMEAGLRSIRYKQVLDGAKHLLNSIQTSNEGLKTFGGHEFHSDQIKKILRCERARAQIR